VCNSGARCTLDGRSVDVGIDCNAGSACELDLRGTTGARVMCRGTLTTCDVDCSTGSTVSCDVECRSGASCVLDCGSATSCAYSRCDGTETPCGGGVIACNRTCP
jgi:hypothetical protein